MRKYICRLLTLCLAGFLIFGFTDLNPHQPDKEWISLFDGKTLDGWRVGDNADTFSVKEEMIVVHGPVAHLFYSGSVGNHNFKNFKFKAEVKTTKSSNSGIYFHTRYQESGWPARGYEVQVNNSHSDPKRTAGLYNVKDVYEAPAKDGQWFTISIKVRGNQITTKVDDKVIAEYTEPEDVGRENRVLSSGTFALQGHDPNSKVYYKNIMVQPL